MARKRVRDQFVHEVSLRQAACFPELGIHAGRGKPRERVHLVDEHFLAPDEEVDSGHAFAAEQPKYLNGKLLKTPSLLRRDLCRNTQSGTIGIDIFCLIRIEAVLARRNNLAESRRSNVACRFFQDGTFNLPRSIQSLFDKDLVVVAERECAGRCEFLNRLRARNTDRRSHLTNKSVVPSAATAAA